MRHQATFRTPSSSHTSAAVGFIGNWPARLVTVATYWKRADEPTDLLDNPGGEFEQAADELQKICITNGITYRPASPNKPAAFPAWLFLKVYPANR